MTPISDVTTHTDAEPDPEPLRLVTHDDLGPLERWTAMPAEAPESERLTAWISVDPSAVVDLEERR
jgi:hypothetical protein